MVLRHQTLGDERSEDMSDVLSRVCNCFPLAEFGLETVPLTSPVAGNINSPFDAREHCKLFGGSRPLIPDQQLVVFIDREQLTALVDVLPCHNLIQKGLCVVLYPLGRTQVEGEVSAQIGNILGCKRIKLELSG